MWEKDYYGFNWCQYLSLYCILFPINGNSYFVYHKNEVSHPQVRTLMHPFLFSGKLKHWNRSSCLFTFKLPLSNPTLLLNRLLHRLPRHDIQYERTSLLFFKSNIRPLVNDPAHLGGRKLSIQAQYGSTRHHLDSLFLELVILLACDSFPSQDKISGVALNDQNQLEIWIQPSLRQVDSVKKFLSNHFVKVMSELGIKEPVPNIDDKPLRPARSTKREHKS